jgi:hypothetical protein
MSICFKGEAVLERWDFGRMLSERGILYDVMILHLSKGIKLHTINITGYWIAGLLRRTEIGWME